MDSQILLMNRMEELALNMRKDLIFLIKPRTNKLDGLSLFLSHIIPIGKRSVPDESDGRKGLECRFWHFKHFLISGSIRSLECQSAPTV